MATEKLASVPQRYSIYEAPTMSPVRTAVIKL